MALLKSPHQRNRAINSALRSVKKYAGGGDVEAQPIVAYPEWEMGLGQDAQTGQPVAQPRAFEIGQPPAPTETGIIERVKEGAKTGFGHEDLGFSKENLQKYPFLYQYQPFARAADFGMRLLPTAIDAAGGLGAGLWEKATSDGIGKSAAEAAEQNLPFGLGRGFQPGKAGADRMQRDVHALTYYPGAMATAIPHLARTPEITTRAALDKVREYGAKAPEEAARPPAEAPPPAQPAPSLAGARAEIGNEVRGERDFAAEWRPGDRLPDDWADDGRQVGVAPPEQPRMPEYPWPVDSMYRAENIENADIDGMINANVVGVKERVAEILSKEPEKVSDNDIRNYIGHSREIYEIGLFEAANKIGGNKEPGVLMAEKANELLGNTGRDGIAPFTPEEMKETFRLSRSQLDGDYGEIPFALTEHKYNFTGPSAKLEAVDEINKLRNKIDIDARNFLLDNRLDPETLSRLVFESKELHDIGAIVSNIPEQAPHRAELMRTVYNDIADKHGLKRIDDVDQFESQYRLAADERYDYGLTRADEENLRRMDEEYGSESGRRYPEDPEDYFLDRRSPSLVDHIPVDELIDDPKLRKEIDARNIAKRETAGDLTLVKKREFPDYDDPSKRSYVFEIKSSNKDFPELQAYFSLEPSKKYPGYKLMHIESIGSDFLTQDTRNVLGPKNLLKLRKQLKEAFPDVKEVSGYRISGARALTGEGAADTPNIRLELGKPYTSSIDDFEGLAEIVRGASRRGVLVGFGEWEARLIPNELFNKNEAKINQTVQSTLQQLAPDLGSHPALNIREAGGAKEAHAFYFRDENGVPLMLWSLAGDDPIRSTRHEAFHHLYNAGYITDQEWESLKNSAKKNNLLEKFGIDERYGEHLSPNVKMEEALAHEFGEWKKGKSKLAELHPIFEKIELFLRKLRMNLAQAFGRDIRLEDFFRVVESGEVGRRTPGPLRLMNDGMGEVKNQTAIHPKTDDKGAPVTIKAPSKPTHETTWYNKNAVATFTPDGPPPSDINNIPFESWKDAPKDLPGWEALVTNPVPEPKFNSNGLTPASGVVVMEPDGRVWIMAPTNKYGGYSSTFPKGRVEEGLSMQANALKELYEETGLRANIVSYLGDFEGDTSKTRYYVARRTGGTPADMGWEAQALHLSPTGKAVLLLNKSRDKDIIRAVKDWSKKGSTAQAEPPKKYPQATSGGYDIEPKELLSYEKIGGKMGSNPGGFYRAPDGSESYIKTPKTADHVRNEKLAALLYRLVGVDVPDLKRSQMGGKDVIVSPIVKGEPLYYSTNDFNHTGLQENFPIDAWLANYDVVGTGKDNVVIDANGKAHRIDLGGSLRYRAQGALKDEFGPVVKELESMRLAKYWDSYEVFGSADEKAMLPAVKRLAAVTDDQIKELVQQYGPVHQSQKAVDKLAETLSQRRDYIVDYFEKKHGPVSSEPSGGPTQVSAIKSNLDDPNIIKNFPEQVGEEILYAAKGDAKKAASDLFDIATKYGHKAVDDVLQSTKGFSSMIGDLDYYFNKLAKVKGFDPYDPGYRPKASFIDTLGAPIDIDDSRYKKVRYTQSDIEDYWKEMSLSEEKKKQLDQGVGDYDWIAGANEGQYDNLSYNKLVDLIESGKIYDIQKEKLREHAHVLTTVKGFSPHELVEMPILGHPKGFKVLHPKKYLDAIEHEMKPMSDLSDIFRNQDKLDLTPVELSKAQLDALGNYKRYLIPYILWKGMRGAEKGIKPETVAPSQGRFSDFRSVAEMMKEDDYFAKILSPLTKPRERGYFMAPNIMQSHGYGAGHPMIGFATNPLVIDWGAMRNRIIRKDPKGGPVYGSYNDTMMRAVLDTARNKSADMIAIHNIEDSAWDYHYGDVTSRPDTQIIFLNTDKNLKSLHAKMKEFKEGLIHTGIAGVGVVGGGLMLNPGDAETKEPEKKARGGAVTGYTPPVRMKRGGMLNSPIPGRTDKIPVNVPAGSYVLPADIPSALGQGNTMAGSEILKKMFTSGPYGLPAMKGKGKPAPMKWMQGPKPLGPRMRAAGGAAYTPHVSGLDDDRVPIIAAGGEFIVHPDVVMAIGGGDMTKGHEIMDRFVLDVRKKHIDTLKKLKPPKR